MTTPPEEFRAWYHGLWRPWYAALWAEAAVAAEHPAAADRIDRARGEDELATMGAISMSAGN